MARLAEHSESTADHEVEHYPVSAERTISPSSLTYHHPHKYVHRNYVSSNPCSLKAKRHVEIAIPPRGLRAATGFSADRKNLPAHVISGYPTQTLILLSGRNSLI